MHDSTTLLKLWRYPVKSMLGEACASAAINERGLVGDRIFAVRDANGKFGSGKNTRRFRHIDGLFRFQASSCEDVPRIVFPDGRALNGDAVDIHAQLSTSLGQPVTLAREETIAHMDAGPIHLVSTASLRWLQAQLPDSQIDARYFRPNLLIDVPGEGLLENTWLDRILHIGPTVQLLVCARTERCGMVSFAQHDLSANAGILRTIAQQADQHFGVYARVLKNGEIRCGDHIVIE